MSKSIFPTSFGIENFQPMINPIISMGIAFLAGSTRLIEYFPSTTLGGLVTTAAFTSSAFAIYDRLTPKTGGKIGGVILAFFLTAIPSIVQDLSKRFVITISEKAAWEMIALCGTVKLATIFLPKLYATILSRNSLENNISKINKAISAFGEKIATSEDGEDYVYSAPALYSLFRVALNESSNGEEKKRFIKEFGLEGMEEALILKTLDAMVESYHSSSSTYFQFLNFRRTELLPSNVAPIWNSTFYNVTYFEGKWKKKFNHPVEGEFLTRSGRKITTQFVTSVESNRYYDSPQGEMIEKEYETGGKGCLSFIIMLPKREDVTSISSEDVIDFYQNGKKEERALRMPLLDHEFTFEEEASSVFPKLDRIGAEVKKINLACRVRTSDYEEEKGSTVLLDGIKIFDATKPFLFAVTLNGMILLEGAVSEGFCFPSFITTEGDCY